MNSRGFRPRRRFRLPWWGWVILVLVILSPFAPERPPEQATVPQSAPAPATPRAVAPEPTFPQAAAILALGRTPAAQVATESSVEGERRYYTFDRPDLGSRVNVLWIGPDEWWVDIDGVAFDHSELGGLRGTVFTSGPLAGLIQNSRIPERVLSIMTPAWAERVGQAP